jgi:tetratricopeptide (TPR) repeat protein
MGWIYLLICIIAAVRLYKSAFFVFSIIITIINFWAFGVMYNFKDTPEQGPDYAAITNFISTIIGIGLLILSFTSLNKQSTSSYSETIKHYNLEIKLNPIKADNYYFRGSAEESLKDYSDAIKDFNLAIELNPKHALAYLARAGISSALKNYAEALDDLNNAIKFDPKLAEAYYARGITKNNLGDISGAIEDLNQSGNLGYKDAFEAIKLIKNR